MRYFILTNNPLAAKEFGETHDVRFINCGLRDVLIKARDLINDGAVLLNHPLYGSVKPNETPFRSLLLQQGIPQTGNMPAPADPDSVRLIGNAVSAFEKFIVKKEITDPKLLEDFQVVDLSLLRSAVESADR
ncbi:MAG: GrdX family protein [Mogibacterium sp.]|nr:GrdX family protein [Mogibacterium sp.]